MRKIMTKDIFAAMRIIKKSGMKQRLIPLIEKAAEKDVAEVGIEGILTVVEVVSETGSEKALYEVLAGPFEMTPQEVESMEMDKFTEMLTELGEQNNIRNFFKAVSGLITSKSLA